MRSVRDEERRASPTITVDLGGRRFSEGTSADREIQRTLMEVRKIVSTLDTRTTRFSRRAAVVESNGWFRYVRQSENYHGDEPT